MNKIITFLIAILISTQAVTVLASDIQNSTVSNSTSTQSQSYVFTSKLRSGMTGSEVYQLQQYLVNHGYLQGSVDGKFGRATYNAVVRLQLDNGLKADGIVGRGTRAVLNAGVIIVDSNNPIVLSPNGGENWAINSTHTITWNVGNNPQDTKIDLYLEPYFACMYSTPRCMVATYLITLDKNISNYTPYNWIAGTDINNQSIQQGTYKVKACIAGTNNCDYSDQAFTLSSGTIAQPSVTVVSPNGGEYWGDRSIHTITWRFNNTSSDTKVDIYLDKKIQQYYPTDSCYNCSPNIKTANIEYILDKSVSNIVPYNWIVGTDVNNKSIDPGEYLVKICLAGTSTCDTSDSSFNLAMLYTL